LTLNEKTQTLNVRCGSSNTDIRGIDAQEFPPMPAPDLKEGIELNVADLREMIHQVAFAASADDARPVLQGVYLTVENNLVNMAATDGFRISVRKTHLSQAVPAPLKAIIPARALNELARIAVDGTEKIVMVIPPGRGQVLFHLKDAELVSQLIEGNFPDYTAIIPRSFKTSTVVSTAALLKACKQAEIIARDGNNVIRLNFQPGEKQAGSIEISAQSEETGSSEIMVEANVDGPSLLIAFNVRYLRDALDVIKNPNVVIETNANNTPGLMRTVGDENFLHVIMPMHLG
jgi:DNA polymerase-3 subunit beta